MLDEISMHKAGHTMLKISLGMISSMAVLMTTYFIWSGSTLVSVDKSVSILTTKMEHYTKELSSVRDSQYTKEQAKSDKEIFMFKINSLDTRLNKLEEKSKLMEKK